MPELKLSYFDVSGRAEMIRLALAIGEIPFTDHRFAKSEWKSIKPSTPCGEVPTLTVDNEQHAQSNAILRYCGKLAGLYPEDLLEALRVDEIMDVINDLVACVFRNHGGNKDGIRESRRKLTEEDIPRYIGGMEKVIKATGDGPWLVGEQLTIADLSCFATFAQLKSGRIDYFEPEVLDKYTRLNESYEAVRTHPQVMAWYENHKKA